MRGIAHCVSGDLRDQRPQIDLPLDRQVGEDDASRTKGGPLLDLLADRFAGSIAEVLSQLVAPLPAQSAKLLLGLFPGADGTGVWSCDASMKSIGCLPELRLDGPEPRARLARVLAGTGGACIIPQVWHSTVYGCGPLLRGLRGNLGGMRRASAAVGRPPPHPSSPSGTSGPSRGRGKSPRPRTFSTPLAATPAFKKNCSGGRSVRHEEPSRPRGHSPQPETEA